MNHKKHRAPHFHRSPSCCPGRSLIERRWLSSFPLSGKRHCHLKDFTTIIPQRRLLFPILASRSAKDPNRRSAIEPGKRAPKILEALRRRPVLRLPSRTAVSSQCYVPPCHDHPTRSRSALGRKPRRKHRGRHALILALVQDPKSRKGTCEALASPQEPVSHYRLKDLDRHQDHP